MGDSVEVLKLKVGSLTIVTTNVQGRIFEETSYSQNDVTQSLWYEPENFSIIGSYWIKNTIETKYTVILCLLLNFYVISYATEHYWTNL